MPKTQQSAPTKSGAQKQSSQPKLSEVAKHLVVPEGITSTGWPAVRDRCAQFGIEFDRWQDGWGRLMLAKRANGLYATSVGGITASIPRQVGKTFTIGAIAFALCVNEPGVKVLWTAHRGQTAAETFDSMQGMAKNRKIAPHIEAIRRTSGEEAVLFRNGSRILFGARERGFGRGFTDVSVVVLDEAQILTERALDDMVPATNSVENALIIKIGTPPKPENPSEVFTRARTSALAGDDKDSLYLEFGADEGASASDWKQLAKANPSYRIGRTSKTAILRMKKNLSEESYLREGLGLWDEVKAGKKAIDQAKWAAVKIPAESVPDEGTKSFAVKFSPDGARVALSVALKPKEGPVHVEGIRVANMGEGTGWLVDFLAERHKEAAQIVVDGKFGTGFLVNALRDAGVKNKNQVLMPTFDQVKSAHSMFLQAVQSGSVSMIEQDELDAEARDAEFRELGKDGGFGWSAPEGGSVLLLETVTFAFWAAKTSKRRPNKQGKGVVVL